MNKKRFKTIWQFAKKYLPLFIIAEICILVSYAVSLLLPLNLTKLTDQVLYGKQYSLLSEVIYTYIILFAIAAVFNLIYAFVWQTLSNRYVVDVKNSVYEKTVFAKAAFLSDMNSGDIMSRIDQDADQFINIIQRNLFHFINSAILCIGIVYMVARINWQIAIVISVAAILPIIFTRICGRFTQKYSKETREKTGAVSGRLFEIIKGFREIKLFCAQAFAKNQIFSSLRQLIKLGNKTRRVDFIVNKSIFFINLSTSLVIYGTSAYFIINGDLTIGVFLAIVQYVALLHKKLNWMLRIYLDWFARKISIDRVNVILDTESEDFSGIEIKEINSIEFENVTFGYNNMNVLNNVSFYINKGEKIALVGVSGVGKTTVIGLLLRFYEPNSGQILINGININTINPASIRKVFGVVSQDILIFEDSIKNNLLLGKEYSNDNINKSLNLAQLDELIKEMPQGIETKISGDSVGLSGGQKQRLMITRLLLKDAKTIILDEATSALDVKTESDITKTIFELKKDATIIVISHRFASIRNCDKIFVLDNSTIDSIGTHEQLLKHSVSYKSLFGSEMIE
ncbi:MAG: ABC transporter ATP-binding protein [Bacillota bacterium]|nr:ABC transporter ATP-binding protein [Bacillota bacterium]